MSSRGTSSFRAAPPICGVNGSYFQNVTGPYYNVTSLYINASAVPSLNGDSTAAIVFFILAYAFVLYFIVRERRLKVHPLDILSHARANVDIITAIWGWVIWSILANTLMTSQACGQPCVKNGDVVLLMASLFLYDLLFLKGFLAYPSDNMRGRMARCLQCCAFNDLHCNKKQLFPSIQYLCSQWKLLHPSIHH